MLMPMTGLTTADQMGGLAMRWLFFGNHNAGGAAQVCSRRRRHRRIHIHIRRHSVSMKRAGFHVTRQWKRGSQGELLVFADWRVRVIKLSGIVDRRSDCMYVRTIHLHGYMDICFRYRGGCDSKRATKTRSLQKNPKISPFRILMHCMTDGQNQIIDWYPLFWITGTWRHVKWYTECSSEGVVWIGSCWRVFDDKLFAMCIFVCSDNARTSNRFYWNKNMISDLDGVSFNWVRLIQTQ